jgi:hypothetical protein
MYQFMVVRRPAALPPTCSTSPIAPWRPPPRFCSGAARNIYGRWRPGRPTVAPRGSSRSPGDLRPRARRRGAAAGLFESRHRSARQAATGGHRLARVRPGARRRRRGREILPQPDPDHPGRRPRPVRRCLPGEGRPFAGRCPGAIVERTGARHSQAWHRRPLLSWHQHLHSLAISHQVRVKSSR